MKKAAVFFAEGFEEIEAITPVDYLRRAGVEVTMVAVGNVNRNVKGAHNIQIVTDINLDSYLTAVNNNTPDVVVIPGGMPGASNIAECNNALAFINKMVQENKLVAAICASPAIVLSKTDALKNKKWTCYPGMQDNAHLYVNNYTDKVPFVCDGNLITGRGPGAAEQFSMEIVRALTGNETVNKIKEASCQR